MPMLASTISIAGSTSSAYQAASPSGSSRASKRPPMCLTMDARTMRESSTTRMRGSLPSPSVVSAPGSMAFFGSGADAHDGAPLDAAMDEVVEGARQRVEVDRARDRREVARLEVGG